MNHLNNKKHHTVKGVLLVAIFLMALFPFIVINETMVELTEPKVIVAQGINPAVELPKHHVTIPKFGEIRDINLKKQQFFDFLKPAIDAENRKLAALREKVSDLDNHYHNTQVLNVEQLEALSLLSRKYKVNGQQTINQQLQQLLLKIDQIPRELVLVQAANESAWGTSRFARIGLNFFGMWCFKRNCGLIPRGRDSGLRHEVATFDSVEQMVNHYFHNINTNPAYDLFRNIRNQLRQNGLQLIPNVLATGLLPYSERGMEYIVEINTMLRHNHRFIKT